MKKVLYSSTALAAAAAVALIPTGDAAAAEKAKKLQIGVGGAMTALVGFANNSSSYEKSNASDTTGVTSYEEFNVWTNTEIHFKGSTKLDSGITVSVEVQLEGDQVVSNEGGEGETIDASFLKVTGFFGDLRIGSTSPATATLSQSAPWTGAIFPGVEDVFWIQKPGAVNIGSPASDYNTGGKMTTGNGSDDVMKISYISPQFAGARFGVYYKPSGSDYNEGMPASGGTGGTEDQELGAVLNYETKMGAVSIKADLGRWSQRGQANDSVDNTRFGMKIGFGDITVGGSVLEVSNSASGVEGTTSSDEGQYFDLGVLFKPKGYSIGLHYLHGEKPFAASAAGDDEKSILSLGATYDLGPGVSAAGTVFMVDYQDELTNDTNNNKGWAAVAGVKVRF